MHHQRVQTRRSVVACSVATISALTLCSQTRAAEPADLARSTAPEAGSGVEEIVVTGTRVSVEGFSSPTPLTVIDAAQFAAAAPTSVGEVLVRLPGFRDFNSPEQRGRFAGGGQSSIDLRGLGGGRT